ncbi:MAG TPA: phosphoglucosamine mutase, partial [Chitinophagaceae bacterium]|nr:phosphoglucosamine mutase [Chitinophagaceae bacterium]
MALIKSISGIRGTIGGKPGDNLTPVDIVKFAAAFGTIIAKDKPATKIVIGRDGRISGSMVQELVVNTLTGLGINVVDLGLSTTPTVEVAVKMEKADGGIILTASHNPKEWNALKLLNEEGEFISAETGANVLELAAREDFLFAFVDRLGTVTKDDSYLQKHIDAILKYPLVNAKAIAKQHFKVVVDAINSTGAIYVPALLKALGVTEVIVLNGEVNGKFAHNPEPLPEHLSQLCNEVVQQKAHLGIAVDPDVDRLCFVNEDGTLFGEEYTLVAVADYVLGKRKGNTVSNMSSTKALKEITQKHGGEYFPSAVGEVNVVNKMKEVNAVIGGEGNGGIIVPDFHYGRDALIGIGLFLSHLADQKKGIKSLRSQYPDYFISKNKIELNNGIDVKAIFEKIKKKYKKNPINTEDGLKIEFENDWVHLRTSNTEPIIRI